MMKASNGWSTLFLGIAIVVTGEGLKFFEFAHRHPIIINNLLVLGLTQAVGQMFLYSMVRLCCLGSGNNNCVIGFRFWPSGCFSRDDNEKILYCPRFGDYFRECSKSSSVVRRSARF